jgi:hypothetical protein
VFQKTADIVGVGHASFTKSPDGTQDWIVYHAHPSPGGNADARVIRIQPFMFNTNGTPNFGAPIFANTVEVPSGVPDAEAPHLPGDFDASGAVTGQDLTTWKAQFGGEKFPGRIVDGADVLAWQRQLGAVAASASAEQIATASAVDVSVASAAIALTTDPAAAGIANPTSTYSRSLAKQRVDSYITPPTAVPWRDLRTESIDHAFDDLPIEFRLLNQPSPRLAIKTRFSRALS